MKRILRIGMDVHSTNYTLCAIEPRFDGDDIIYANVKVTPDPNNIVQFIENLKKKIKEECNVIKTIVSMTKKKSPPAIYKTNRWTFL